MKGSSVDQGQAIEAYRVAVSRARDARDAESWAEAQWHEASQVLGDAKRAVAEAESQMKLAICGQSQTEVAQQMVDTQINRAFGELATAVKRSAKL